jgi:glycosyltransferase involved in cell wall biosynthesis
MSTDGTREYLSQKVGLLKRKQKRRIKIFDNPQKIISTGLNIGIKKARGDIIWRIDGHSEVAPDYLEKGVKRLLSHQKDKVVCVGGQLESVGQNFWGKILADLYSSLWGVGNSTFRLGTNKPTFSDTAVFGLYWKWIFEKVGYFDETLIRNEDVTLHSKIIKAGYKFLTDPNCRAKYYVRKDIFKFIRKTWSDGYWITASKVAYLRHKIPLLFLLYLISCPISFLFLKHSLLKGFYFFPLFLYFLLSLFFSFKDGKTFFNKVALVFTFPFFHLTYGLGSFAGLLSLLFRKGEKKGNLH